MKALVKKTIGANGEVKLGKDITKEELLEFQRKFMEAVTPITVEPSPLFGSDERFSCTNYASGLDLLLREYFDELSKSPRINGSYSVMIQDVIKAIFCVSRFKTDATAIVMLDYYNKSTGRYDSYIYDICWDLDGRKLTRFRVNNNIGCFDQFIILINFIADYGISHGLFGKIKEGYKFNLANIKRSYKGI